MEEREGERAAIEELKREYKKKYQKEFRLLKEDWYRMYDALLVYRGMGDIIQKTDVTVLGCGSEVTDKEGEILEEGKLLA